MSDETEGALVECVVCGSTDYCLTKKHTHSIPWIKCRQCNNVFGLAVKTKYKEIE